MKGIYLSPEGKALIEAKIAELNDNISKFDEYSAFLNVHYTEYVKEKEILKEILSSATVLPVEESWKETLGKQLNKFQVGGEDSTLEGNYPDGLIIQPKL